MAAYDHTLLFRARFADPEQLGADGDTIARPGPGRLVFTETSGSYTQTGGKLSFAGSDIACLFGCVTSDGAAQRSNYPCLTARYAVSLDPGVDAIGVFGTATPSVADAESFVYSDNMGVFRNQLGGAIADHDYTSEICLAVQCMPEGAAYFAGYNFGRMVLVGRAFNDASDRVYFGHLSQGNTGTVDGVSVFNSGRIMPELLLSEASPTLNNTTTVGAELLIDVGIVFAALTANQYGEALFRYIDSSNYWRMRAAVNAGGTGVDVTLAKVIAGSATVVHTATDVLTAAGTLYLQVASVAGPSDSDTAVRHHLSARISRTEQVGETEAAGEYVQPAALATDSGTGVRFQKSGANVTLENANVWRAATYKIGEV